MSDRTSFLLGRLEKRISLTTKMLLITVTVGIVLWAITDYFQNNSLKEIHLTKHKETIRQRAAENRMHFDAFIKKYYQSVKLFTTGKRLNDYLGHLEEEKWGQDNAIQVRYYSQPPPWFPDHSIIRTFIPARFVILLDQKRRVREVYISGKDTLPDFFLKPHSVLYQLSQNQSFLTSYNNTPYIVASKNIAGAQGSLRGILTLVSPIDDKFLVRSQGATNSWTLLALVTGLTPYIVASNNEHVLPAGTKIDALRDRFIIEQEGFFDYGNSDLIISLATFFPRSQIEAETSGILSKQRTQRAINHLIFILTFALIMYWITRHIGQVTQHIIDFSQYTLGMKPGEMEKGDQLYILRNKLHRLTKEVVEARDIIKREAEEHTRLIVDNAFDAIVTLDAEGTIRTWNPSAEVIFGWTHEEAIGRKAADTIILPRYFYRFKKAFKDYPAEASGNILNKQIEITARHRDGREFPVEISISPAHSGSGYIFISIIRDITERTYAKQQLRQQALFDQLTGLPNRILFTRRLKRLFERSQPHTNYLFAVLFMDLDRFKLINDSLGHIIGDKLLVAASRRIELCIRPNDTAARFGGDEFAVLLEKIPSTQDVVHIADRIQKDLTQPFHLDGTEVFTSASIGIALSSTDYDNETNILRDADAAMYRAKALGKARYEIFDSVMHDCAMKLIQLEADLRRAVAHNEFLIYYQPIMSLTSGRIAAAEALIRWQHPQRGLILPHEFISVAEETGLISAIGEWSLKTACARNKAWHDAGFQHVGINVNFSARQFQHNDLSAIVRRVLHDTGLPPDCLNIEITESIAMEDYTIELLNELAALGIKIVIDDFGTGFSSLRVLKRFPINAVKIDKSFVQDITVDRKDEAIVKAIIAMAHSLKMEVVAEGVETKEQLLFLQSNLCDKAQGYLFSKPLAETEFPKVLEEGFFSSFVIYDEKEGEKMEPQRPCEKIERIG